MRLCVRVLVSAAAIAIFAMVTYGQDSDAASYIETGTRLWHQANYTGAVSNYTKAIDLDEALLNSGKLDDAQLKRLAGTYLLRARVHRILWHFDESLDDISRCLK